VTFAGPESAARVAQHTEWLREEASRRPGQTAGTETTPR